jgi:putative transposase
MTNISERWNTATSVLVQRGHLSHVFAGQNVGVTQVGERIWLVTFMQYDLGYFDDEACRLELIENPFGPKVLPLRSE